MSKEDFLENNFEREVAKVGGVGVKYLIVRNFNIIRRDQKNVLRLQISMNQM